MHMKANLTLPVQVAECQTFHTSEVSIQRCRPALWTVQHGFSRFFSQKHPTPRFFPYKVTCASLIGGFQAGFAVLSVQFLC